MLQRDCGRNLVDVLAARSRRSGKRLLQLGLANTELLHSFIRRLHTSEYVGTTVGEADSFATREANGFAHRFTYPQSATRNLKNCRWPDSNRHGPFTAQRILSPLRLPFRHIGVTTAFTTPFLTRHETI